MSDGLATTFRILSISGNDAATRVLLPALDSPHQSIQEGALVALLGKRNPAGQSAILKRIPSLSPRWKGIISQHPGRLTGALRDALLGKDEILYQNACKAAVMFRDYDLIPALLAAIEDVSPSKADMAAKTLLQLVSLFYDEFAHSRQNDVRQDHQWIRQNALACLETSAQRFGKHRRREMIEAFLLLVDHNNATLNQILQNPHHVSFLVLVEIMSSSSQEGVIELLLSYLEDPQVPSAVLNVVTNRCDLKFIRHFLRKIARGQSDVVRQNLKRIQKIAWLRNIENVVDQLDDAAQQSMVLIVMETGIARAQIFSVIKYILLHGKPGGRREAALSLAAFSGADANALALRALDDPDPQVQANIISQIRHRGIHGMQSRLVEKLESPHLEVRSAARASLTEFSFPRYLGTFEILEDEERRTIGALVKKVDQQTIPLLQKELKSPVRFRRLRGLQIARALEIADQVEEAVIDLLKNEDHVLRREAAATLAECPSAASRQALEAALHDSSLAVREVVQRSLQEQALYQNVRKQNISDE